MMREDTFKYLTFEEDFNLWQPEEYTVTAPRFGERQIPGLAELHNAIAQLSTPDGKFTPYPSETK